MESDSEGFWYPKVNVESCLECGLCEKVCPIIYKNKVINTPKAYACYNKNEKIRMESSSGGLFTLFAEQVIDNDGVVFGARFDDKFNVIHDFVETKEELSEFRGSKYVQSKIGETYKKVKEYLSQGRQVLFSGTPCQIGGLKSYLMQDYDNLLCIDIICHGVPSLKVWQKYISYQKNYFSSHIHRIAFRCKDQGWKRFSLSILFKNNKEYKKTLDKDLYMKAFLKDICLRPSCYECQFKTLHRQSDITLADFWGIENVFPDMYDDKGTSLIFINSIKGYNMLKKINENILYKEVNINDAIVYNTAAIKSANYNKKRENFFKELDTQPFNKLIRKYCSDSQFVKIKRVIKTLVYNALKKVKIKCI
jgi:coenzyme F420-reducing hydrogenase beta subunit